MRTKRQSGGDDASIPAPATPAPTPQHDAEPPKASRDFFRIRDKNILEVFLNGSDDSVVCTAPGNVSYMDADVERVVSDGTNSIMERFILQPTRGDINAFKSPREKRGRIVITPPFPGEIRAEQLVEGRTYKIARGSFLAATQNVKLIQNPRSGLSDAKEGKFMDLVKVEGSKPAFLFLVGAGTVDEFLFDDATSGTPNAIQKIIVNAEHLLFAPAEMRWLRNSMSTSSTLFMTIEKGASEKRFKIMVQTRGVQQHAMALSQSLRDKKMGGGVSVSTAQVRKRKS